ncbi:hypothetical protein [Halobacterium jilantaiense]|uniref:hypothetical protein n=1 Tax=Halobacterium jilantaiense TaxID=355548 RepID=UPI000B7CAA12|nr:hypothetical protein [Halobacterium jilantaiense]
MQSRWPALLVVGFVLLAGCGGTGPTGVTPENPQTTYVPAETTTASSPPALTVLHSGDGPTTVRVTLGSVPTGTTFYERETTMDPGSQLYLTSEVADRDQYRITVSTANATHTHDVYAGEGYVVTVANDSAIDGRHTTD